MSLFRYLTQYRFRDMGELIRNGKGVPKSCEGSLAGKTVVLSGATSGVGRAAARLFAQKGARLICLNRDKLKSEELEAELRERFDADVQTLIVDIGSLTQVRECAEELERIDRPIDVLIHNAGVFRTRKQFTEDGIESVFQINHLGPFLLTCLTADRLKKENRARIIFVNSEGHRFSLAGVHTDDLEWKRHRYTGLKSYGAAKTAQLLTMMRFNQLFSGSSVTVNAMHPGNVVSNIGGDNGRLYLAMKKRLILSTARDPEISARALYYLAASEEMEGVSGAYFNLTAREKPAPHARDAGAVEGVWRASLDLCGLT
jgi:NAD(P)-dependent dehydrogenase (short-subunit alcohol dehydrogenase family)